LPAVALAKAGLLAIQSFGWQATAHVECHEPGLGEANKAKL